jgi:HEAT repeat protein
MPDPKILRPPRSAEFPPILTVHDWLHHFRSPNPLVREDAVQALVALGDQVALVVAGVILLPSKSFTEKEAARQVLLRLITEKRSPVAVEAVARLVQAGNDGPVRIEALDILREAGPLILQLLPQTLRTIQGARASGRKDVREAAVLCLEALGVEQGKHTKPYRSTPSEYQDDR